MSNLFLLGRRIIAALVTCTLLAGCSAMKLGYSNAPDLAYWWLDGYVDFNDAQRSRVRDDLTRLHQWHRAQELPRLAELLRRAERLVPGEISAEQACELWSLVRERLAAVSAQAEDAVLATALTLTPQQQRHMEKRNERNNAEWRKDWIDASAEERIDKRFKQTIERSEMVYGRLDNAQRALVRQQLQASAFDAQRTFAERQRRQAVLLQTLRRAQAPGVSPEQGRALLRGYFAQLQTPTDASAQRYTDTLTQEGCRLVAIVHSSTTPAQRQQAATRLRAYQRDLAELSAAR